MSPPLIYLPKITVPGGKLKVKNYTQERFFKIQQIIVSFVAFGDMVTFLSSQRMKHFKLSFKIGTQSGTK